VRSAAVWELLRIGRSLWRMLNGKMVAALLYLCSDTARSTIDIPVG
jgi:hypothetical protein